MGEPEVACWKKYGSFWGSQVPLQEAATNQATSMATQPIWAVFPRDAQIARREDVQVKDARHTPLWLDRGRPLEDVLSLISEGRSDELGNHLPSRARVSYLDRPLDCQQQAEDGGRHRSA